MNRGYDDLMGMPHHVSRRRPRMPVIERAAQFSPFATLTGYDAAVRETARLTDSAAELDESEKARLDLELRELAEGNRRGCAVRIVHFVPDGRKEGGTYVGSEGVVKKIDPLQGVVIMADGQRIPLDGVAAVEEL